jgi:NitT/TauT family transport system permease protein
MQARPVAAREAAIVTLGVFGFFALWEAGVWGGWINPTLAPAPSTIIVWIGRLLARGEVISSLGVSAWEVVAAFLISLPVGFFIGFMLAEVRFLGAVLRPAVNFLFGVPKSIFLPVFILMFGVSIPQKIAFGVFTTVFVLIFGGIAAVQSVPRELVLVSRAYGASRWQIVREIYLPAMAPILLESARLGMIFNVTAVLLCEIYGARDGIGYRIAAWGENFQMPQLYAALFIVSVLAVLVNEALRVAEARLSGWRQAQ